METGFSQRENGKRRSSAVPWAVGAWLGQPAPPMGLPWGLPAVHPALEAALAPLRELMPGSSFSFMPPPQAEPHVAKLQQAIKDGVLAQINRFVEGVKAYRSHPANRNAPPAPIVWQKGTTKLRDYGASSKKGAAVLVVPSLINRYDILDLDEGHSLLRFMDARGLRPFVVDWDAPGEEEKKFSLTDYAVQRLFPILDYVQSVAPRPHILGYCMGGNLALALALLRRGDVRSLALMATPWNNALDPALRELVGNMEPHLSQADDLPADILQMLFASFQPMQVAQKFTRFASLDPDGAEARRFVLTEDWLNDGVPLAAEVARECLIGWYVKNVTGKIQWRVADTLVDPRLLDMPAYVLAAGKDHIVPPESARPLARLMRGAVLHEPAMGHTGLMASRSAPREVWEPLVRFLTGQ